VLPPTPASVEIRRLDRATLEPAIECVRQLYPRHNRIARALGFTPDDYRSIAESVCQVALAADMGLLVVEPATGAVHGFLFCHDLVDQFSAVERMAQHENDRLRSWAELHVRLLQAYAQRFGQPQRGQVLYGNIAALAPEVRGRGLTPTLLYRAMVEFGIQRGYRRMVGIATHPQSHELVANLPGIDWFQELAFRELSDTRLHTLEDAARIAHRPLPESADASFQEIFGRPPPTSPSSPR
jgi:GNAT superfamily N-acetyltransferase